MIVRTFTVRPQTPAHRLALCRSPAAKGVALAGRGSSSSCKGGPALPATTHA